MINNKAEDFILLFIEKSITEKNLTKPTIDVIKMTSKAFIILLKKKIIVYFHLLTIL